MSEYLHELPDGRVFVDYGPTSMVITARRQGAPAVDLAKAAFPLIQDALGEIAKALSVLRQYPGEGDFSQLEGLPRVMAEAVLATGEETLTPMAAVAGTVADAVADWIFAQGAEFVAVNNGGDVALRLGPGQQMRMGILPDLNGSISQVVTLRAEDGIGGVCTSGLGGRSLTRGIANSVTVFSHRCALADACATHIANCSYIDSPRVHTCLAGELEPESDIAALRIVRQVEALEEREIRQGLEQVHQEALRQLERGNLVSAAADIQGLQLWVPEPLNNT
ncbi:UPF0280 family protein [uncultured Dysosmobacter sp.]|uniref:UPF0280 family protein n=1 Tax=uncultured Dysosmobacter sp. TaxID=2591384 RepID=UPI00263024A4|nr:hypothetical protein [uncultured Dysosmobacter sp.]